MQTLAWAPQTLEGAAGMPVSVLELHTHTLLPQAFIESLVLPGAACRGPGAAAIQA